MTCGTSYWGSTPSATLPSAYSSRTVRTPSDTDLNSPRVTRARNSASVSGDSLRRSRSSSLLASSGMVSRVSVE